MNGTRASIAQPRALLGTAGRTIPAYARWTPGGKGVPPIRRCRMATTVHWGTLAELRDKDGALGEGRDAAHAIPAPRRVRETIGIRYCTSIQPHSSPPAIRAVKKVTYARYWLMQEHLGKRRKSRWLMTEAEALERDLGAIKVPGSEEVRLLPETQAERDAVRFDPYGPSSPDARQSRLRRCASQSEGGAPLRYVRLWCWVRRLHTPIN